MLTFTAYEVTSVSNGKVTTADGVFPLSDNEPKVQKGWFRISSHNNGKVEYMTKAQMEFAFAERDTY